MDFDRNRKILTEEEEKLYSKQFKKVWECNNIDRRSKIFFPTLSQDQEKIVVAELTNYIIYYFQHENIIDDFVQKQFGKTDTLSIVSFWYNQIGKSKSLDTILQDLSVYADCVSFFEKQSKYIKILSNYFVGQNIYRKELFRTEQTAQQLYNIYKYPYKNKEAIEFLHKNNLDADHISEKKARDFLYNLSNFTTEKKDDDIPLF